MVKALLRWLRGAAGSVASDRPDGQSCLSCAHFIDYKDPDESDDEVDGICAHPVVRELFNEGARASCWQHSESWCSRYVKDDGTNGWYPKRTDPDHSAYRAAREHD